MENIKIEPFHIHIDEEKLIAIKTKVANYDWDIVADAGGWDAGVGIADLKRLINYWAKFYDWRKTEEKLNRLQHFLAKIDGETIHFIHFKGTGNKHPILLMHGWPGSFLEFGTIPEKLAEAGHDVIVPSLPGFAFSKPITSVTAPRRAAELMGKLMKYLYGNTGYAAQGGDWGAHISSWMACLKPAGLLGIHINMAGVYAADATPASSEEQEIFDKREKILDWETGYNHEQETRPQTLGIAMSDSPVGIAAWIFEKIGKWSDLPKKPDGSPDIWSKFTEQELLDNIMLYIVNSAQITSTWIYLGKRQEGSGVFPAGTFIDLPTGIAAFPDPVFIPTPESFLRRQFNIIHWTNFSTGGHFAAMEEPDLFFNDLKKFMEKIAVIYSDLE